MKRREFWIEFGGDPSDDKEVYKRYSAASPFEPASYAEEVFHCIVYEEYERLQLAIKEALSHCGWALNQAEDYNVRNCVRKAQEVLQTAIQAGAKDD